MIGLRKAVQGGLLGTIDYCTAEMSTSSGLGMKPGYWRTDTREAPAGAMTGIGVHIVDAIIDLVGEIEQPFEQDAIVARIHGRESPETQARPLGFASAGHSTYLGTREIGLLGKY